VVVLTAHHDRARAFPQTLDGILDVRARGRLLPMQVGGRLRAPCAILRMAYLAAVAARERADVVVCDLVSHAIPVFRLLGRARVVFYCHYPDRFLARPGGGWLYRRYRAPIDRLEAMGARRADRVITNSRFAAAHVRAAFGGEPGFDPVVVYPGVDLVPVADAPADSGPVTLLSVGRFDPRKNLPLAVDALAALRARLTPADFARVRLVLAGSCDARLREQDETQRSLAARARELGVADAVTVRSNPSEAERRALVSESRCIVYTPDDEHFGYVPLEAMAAGRPVVAVHSGGPSETIVDGTTGRLCAPTAPAFADALALLVTDHAMAVRMGAAGRAHVAQHFSRAAYARRIAAVFRDLAPADPCTTR